MNEATRLFIKNHLNDDVRTLALKSFPDDVDKMLVLNQIKARNILVKKVPSWTSEDVADLIFPQHLSIEQCSSELTAKYKADVIELYFNEIDVKSSAENSAERKFVDLTGGLGVDTHFISKKFAKTFYVECQSELCDLVAHNFAVLGDNVEVVNDDSDSYLARCTPMDCMFIDPARRDSLGRKMVSLHDCSPDVASLQNLILSKTKILLVKLSPMLDISMALSELRNVKDVFVLSVKNECKEILMMIESDFYKESENIGGVIFHCTDLHEGFEFSYKNNEEKDAPLILADNLCKYLYEPNVSLMKAGCFKLVAHRFNVLKLHKNSHLYTSDTLITDFPGRIFEVEGFSSFNKKVKKELLGDVSKASIATRNFPISAEELRKRLQIVDGEDFYIFGTTIRNDERVIIKTKKVAK